MTLPTIHLNGTGAETLREDYLKAYHAIGAAEQALQSVEFNARDYYVQGPEAYPKARAERGEQFKALRKIQAELMEVLEHVQEAIDAKSRQQESRP